MKLAAVLLVTLPALAQGGVKWEHTLEAAKKRAKAEKKMIFMDLWAEWCGPCQYLRKNVFPSAEGQAALATVVPFDALVQTNDQKDIPANAQLAEKYGLNAFPTLILIDADGKEIRRQVGAFRTGADFAKWIKGGK